MNDEFVEVISKYIFQDLNGIKKQKPRNIHLEVQYSKSLYQCACSLKRVHIVDMVGCTEDILAILLTIEFSKRIEETNAESYEDFKSKLIQIMNDISVN